MLDAKRVGSIPATADAVTLAPADVFRADRPRCVMLLGVAEGFATDLSVQQVAGVLRCTSGEGTPGWAKAVSSVLSYGTVVPLIIAGIVVWIRQKTPALFLAGFLMFAFSALGPATGNFDLIFFISMFGEVCMALFFLIYAKQKE